MPKVSVLMPVYNAQQYLAEAIDSIINQTFTDWELLIINDGSTDDSEAIIKSYQDFRIRYIENESNLKLIATLNKGIALCQGDYIARMDADDIAMPGRLRQQVAFMDSHPDYVMCGADATIIDMDGTPKGTIRNLQTNDLLQINLLFSSPFVHPVMMIRRSALINNLYDSNYIHAEDYELWCRLSKQGKIANIGKELLKYRWHDTNISVVYSDIQEQKKSELIRKELLAFGLNPTDEELYYHRITFLLYRMGKKQNVSVDVFDGVGKWFEKLITQNQSKGTYNQSTLIAYLWSRWIVLCISQKRYTQILKPQFASYRMSVLSQLFKLVLHLKNK